MNIKRMFLLSIIFLCFITGCSKIPKLSYSGEDILYACSNDDVNLFRDELNVIIKKNQGFIYIDNNENRKEYTDGLLEFNDENKIDVKECYFISYNEMTGNKYKSKSSIAHRDPIEGSIRISVSGNYSYKVVNSKVFIDNYTSKEILNNYINSQINAIYILNMNGKTFDDLSKEKQFDESKMTSLNLSASKYGIKITEVNIETVEKK